MTQRTERLATFRPSPHQTLQLMIPSSRSMLARRFLPSILGRSSHLGLQLATPSTQVPWSSWLILWRAYNSTKATHTRNDVRGEPTLNPSIITFTHPCTTDQHPLVFHHISRHISRTPLPPWHSTRSCLHRATLHHHLCSRRHLAVTWAFTLLLMTLPIRK